MDFSNFIKELCAFSTGTGYITRKYKLGNKMALYNFSGVYAERRNNNMVP